MLHSICTYWDRVDSWLFVVGSQIASLTPSPFFDHNLCCRCLNGSCKAISTSRLQNLSNGIKNTSRWGVLTFSIELWSCGSPKGLQVSTFGSASLILTLASKWGYDIVEPKAIHRPIMTKVVQQLRVAITFQEGNALPYDYSHSIAYEIQNQFGSQMVLMSPW